MLTSKLRPKWGKRPAESITKADIIAAIRAVPGTGAAKNNLHRMLSKLFKWASTTISPTTGTPLLATNPMLGLSLPTPPKKRDRVLADDELRELWQFLDGDALHPQLALWLKLRLLTAQRAQEVLAMQWSQNPH